MRLVKQSKVPISIALYHRATHLWGAEVWFVFTRDYTVSPATYMLAITLGIGPHSSFSCILRRKQRRLNDSHFIRIRPNSKWCKSYYLYSLFGQILKSSYSVQPYLHYSVLCIFFAVMSRIRVKTLNEKSDVKALAKEIIDKCKLIHPSKILEVEQLLFYLQNRKDTGPTKGMLA